MSINHKKLFLVAICVLGLSGLTGCEGSYVYHFAGSIHDVAGKPVSGVRIVVEPLAVDEPPSDETFHFLGVRSDITGQYSGKTVTGMAWGIYPQTPPPKLKNVTVFVDRGSGWKRFALKPENVAVPRGTRMGEIRIESLVLNP